MSLETAGLTGTKAVVRRVKGHPARAVRPGLAGEGLGQIVHGADEGPFGVPAGLTSSAVCGRGYGLSDNVPGAKVPAATLAGR